MGKLGHLPGGGEPLGKAGNSLIDELAPQPSGNEVEIGSSAPCTRSKRARQAFAKLVQPLGHRLKDRPRLGPAADGEVQPLAAALRAPCETMARSVGKLAKLAQELAPDRNRNLGSCGRSGCAPVGGMIDKSGVGL